MLVLELVCVFNVGRRFVNVGVPEMCLLMLVCVCVIISVGADVFFGVGGLSREGCVTVVLVFMFFLMLKSLLYCWFWCFSWS